MRALLVAASFIAAQASGGKTPRETEGVTYQRYSIREEPWSIHVIRIDRSQKDLEIITTLGDGGQIGLSTMTRQLRTIPSDAGVPVAAINGDFYSLERETYAGDPRGLHIMRGELISDPIVRTCVWIDSDGNPHMGEVASGFSVSWPNGENTPFGLNEERAGNPAVLYTAAIGESTLTSGGTELILERVSPRKWLPLTAGTVFPARVREVRRGGNSPLTADTLVLSLSSRRTPLAEKGDILMLSTATQPSLAGVRTAIGGGPALVRNAKAAPGRAQKAYERHPRSAFGWNSKHFFFVEVDGRQPRLSVGMDVRELAEFMVQIGCEEGMNLDG
ncbi:MAG TPA: phosphodiester glycosidase family protein, partial [Verrucomicrobiae bacterium]|nr:phosphodiester glycosidase family protein [Verrucomicrobiae bacterium]